MLEIDAPHEDLLVPLASPIVVNSSHAFTGEWIYLPDISGSAIEPFTTYLIIREKPGGT